MKKITRDLELEKRFIGMIESSEREMVQLGWTLADSYLDCYKKYKCLSHDLRIRYNLPSTGNVSVYGPDYPKTMAMVGMLRTMKKIARHNERERRHHGGHEVSFYGIKRQGDGGENAGEVRKPDELG